MIREAFNRLMDEYTAARNEQFTGHHLASYIRHDLPKMFQELFPDHTDLIWTASPGQGRWVDAPWIAAFDPLVTDTAQDGYYPVYLFTRSLDSVYLSLNQGMQSLREEFGGPEAKEILNHRARIMRSRLSPEYQEKFTSDPINLQAVGSGDRLAFYEPGHAFGVRYDREALPDNDQFLADLAKILSLYRLLTIRGGTQEMDQVPILWEESPEYFANLSLEEKRRLRLHCTIERNPNLARLAKKYHGYQCQVCDFDFKEIYGDLGECYIEAHHLTPLSKLPHDKPVSLSPVEDFAVVCANCHRMIHRSNAPESFEEFIEHYQNLNP